MPRAIVRNTSSPNSFIARFTAQQTILQLDATYPFVLSILSMLGIYGLLFIFPKASIEKHIPDTPQTPPEDSYMRLI